MVCWGSVPEFIQYMKQEIYFMKCKNDIEKVLLYLVFEMDVWFISIEVAL